MDYCVVEASSRGELEGRVRELLEAGWEPQGGVSVATHGAGIWWYFQALVRRRA